MPAYDLHRADDINKPVDLRELRRNRAETCDSGFVATRRSFAPSAIAAILIHGVRERQPILGIGAGTGLVAQHLRNPAVDGIVIAPEMPAQAGKKGLYRRRTLGDPAKPLGVPGGVHGGVVSPGTFTRGHVGPGCLPELSRDPPGVRRLRPANSPASATPPPAPCRSFAGCHG